MIVKEREQKREEKYTPREEILLIEKDLIVFLRLNFPLVFI